MTTNGELVESHDARTSSYVLTLHGVGGARRGSTLTGLRSCGRSFGRDVDEARVEAHPPEVLAQGLGVLGVAGPGLASLDGDAAG